MQSNLVQIMSEKGITIRTLVAQTGISSATIQKARDHRIANCRLETLNKIAKALGVSLLDILEMETKEQGQ